MKTGDDGRYISTLQAADALGVSVSTVKRWVDEAILPAHRTPGGHRKLLRSEVIAFARHAAFADADPMVLSICEQAIDFPASSAALYNAMVHGDGLEVGSIIHGLYRASTAIETLADRVIAPALERLGRDWECARIDVWQEHRGTQLCLGALYDLRQELEMRAERDRPSALGAAAEGDPTLAATLLAQMTLIDAGWSAVNLGSNTPLASLTRAMREIRPRLVWLSLTHLDNAVEFLRSYGEFYRVAERMGIAVVVGGRALIEPIRAAMPYTAYGDGLTHLAAFAHSLHPRPRRPERGRPKRLSKRAT